MGRVKRKVPSSMRKNVRNYILCTCARYHPGICSTLKHSTVSDDSVSGQWMPRSDCADAQADLGLHYPHMPGDTISHEFIIIIIIILITLVQITWLIRKKGKRPLCHIRTARFRWACAFVQSDLDILCSLLYTTIYIDSFFCVICILLKNVDDFEIENSVRKLNYHKLLQG